MKPTNIVSSTGFVSTRDLLTTIACLEATLIELGGGNFAPQAGIKAAAELL